jgi:hypothetical protein
MASTPGKHHWVFSKQNNHLFIVSDEVLPAGQEHWIEDTLDLKLDQNLQCYSNIVCNSFAPSHSPILAAETHFPTQTQLCV